MSTPDSLPQNVINKSIDIFSGWLKKDFLGHNIAPSYSIFGQEPISNEQVNPCFRNVREVISFINSLYGESNNPTGRFSGLPPIPDMSMPLKDFYQLPFQVKKVGTVTLGYFFHKFLCYDLVPSLLFELSTYPFLESSNSVWDELLEFRKASGLSEEDERYLFTDLLHVTLLGFEGAKPLHSFYSTKYGDSGYRNWGEYAKYESGKRLKLKKIPINHYDLEVDVFKNVTEDEYPLTKYDWYAELKIAGSDIPEAICYGMFFKLDREDGLYLDDPVHLIFAADEAVPEVDMLMVDAFFSQHPDASYILYEDDPCFVWLWERKRTSEKGVGKIILTETIKELKKRFPRFGTLIFDIKPGQLEKPTVYEEPSAIQVIRQDAVSSLHEYVSTFTAKDLSNASVKFIVNNHEGDSNQALHTLGKYLVAGSYFDVDFASDD